MDRRDFLTWLSGAGAAVMLPQAVRAALTRSDEQPLESFADSTLRINSDGTIDVFVRLEPEPMLRDLAEMIHVVIDRPLFGMKPRTFTVWRLQKNPNAPATAWLRSSPIEGDAGVAHFLDGKTGEFIGEMQTHRFDRFDGVAFIPASSSGGRGSASTTTVLQWLAAGPESAVATSPTARRPS